MKFTTFSSILIILSCHTFVVAADNTDDKSPTSFTYVLQAEHLASTRKKVVEALTKSDRDWIVLDMAYQGNQLWTKTEIATIRQGKTNRKVIAYLSIGEAEDYRSYWKKEWSEKHPPFVLKENKDWKGNFQVKYWNKQWQQIIAKQIETIMTTGFDGLYLDKVDAYEDYEYDSKTKDWIDHRRNAKTNKTYREEMILFGKDVAKIARKFSPKAIIIPQNGGQLLSDKTWLNTIDALGIEDLFSDGEKMQSRQTINYRNKQTLLCTKQGKPVLSVDYSTNIKMQQAVQKKSKHHHHLLLITDRDLTTLGK